MILPISVRFGIAFMSLALSAGAVLAGPPPVRPAPAPVRPQPYPRYSGTRVVIGVGIGGGYYGSGLYGPLGYGLGYSPFGYSGLNYGGLGYGPLGYGYGYPGRSVGVIGVPVIPGTYYATPYQYQSVPAQPIPVQPMVSPDPQPLPLPLPMSGNTNTSEGKPGTLTVITNDGARVTFDGVDTGETGARHSFTTKPIAPGAEIRVKVQVDGPGGPSSISIGLRSGEKATVDMRK